MSVIAQMDQRVVIAIGTQNNVAAITTVTTIRSSFGDILLAPKVSRTVATSTAAANDFYLIDKVPFCSH